MACLWQLRLRNCLDCHGQVRFRASTHTGDISTEVVVHCLLWWGVWGHPQNMIQHPETAGSNGVREWLCVCALEYRSLSLLFFYMQAGKMGWSKTVIGKQRVSGSGPEERFFQLCCYPQWSNLDLVDWHEEIMDAANGICRSMTTLLVHTALPGYLLGGGVPTKTNREFCIYYMNPIPQKPYILLGTFLGGWEMYMKHNKLMILNYE